MSVWVLDLGFFSELLRDYLFVLLFLVLVAGWFLLRRLPNWIRAIRGADWPTAEGKVETVNVNTFAEQSLGEVGYSYSVEGVPYSGYFSRQFADEQDAWSYVGPLKGQTVFVRYKPSSPGISALRLGEQSVLFRARTGSFLRPRLVFSSNSSRISAALAPHRLVPLTVTARSQLLRSRLANAVT